MDYSIKAIITTLFAPLLFVFISAPSCAQGVSSLDKKRGFKKFKIGQDIDRWKENIEYEGNKKINGERSDNEIYKYTGNCCSRVFDEKVISTYLEFKNEKLIGIHLSTEPHTVAECEGNFDNWKRVKTGPSIERFNSIKNNLSGLFGPPDISDGSKTEQPTLFHAWQSDSVSLTLSYQYHGICKYDITKIMVYKNSELDKNLKSGF